ncbi:hypothetical protein K440DRAFT_199880 [Wilcoxina mikolae CBS 423.85]|nr:hypothetical protein K440DRAFT_199880 [Wilcoxina mikolae CBS 423.85]
MQSRIRPGLPGGVHGWRKKFSDERNERMKSLLCMVQGGGMRRLDCGWQRKARGRGCGLFLLTMMGGEACRCRRRRRLDIIAHHRPHPNQPIHHHHYNHRPCLASNTHPHIASFPLRSRFCPVPCPPPLSVCPIPAVLLHPSIYLSLRSPANHFVGVRPLLLLPCLVFA